jgi:hypothetical protein
VARGLTEPILDLLQRCMDDDAEERPADAHMLVEELAALQRPEDKPDQVRESEEGRYWKMSEANSPEAYERYLQTCPTGGAFPKSGDAPSC